MKLTNSFNIATGKYKLKISGVFVNNDGEVVIDFIQNKCLKFNKLLIEPDEMVLILEAHSKALLTVKSKRILEITRCNDSEEVN